MKEITVGRNDAGQRLDKFLLKTYKTLPPALLYKAIRQKDVKRNGKRCTQDEMISAGDVLRVYLPDDALQADGGEDAFRRVTPRLDIVYEDENILLVNKAQGLICHSDDKESYNTLISQIQAYLWRKGEYVPEEENSFAPALCNRIDQFTGGLVLAAKDAETLRILNEKIKAREISKWYLCPVVGVMRPQEATKKAYLRKDAAENLVTVSDVKRPGMREIVTKYRTLSVCGDASLLEVELVTGRTHQIRAHLAHLGHPIIGDGKYGFRAENRKYGAEHQLLFAYKLCFAFPTGAGKLDYLRGKTVKIREIPALSRFL